MNHINASSGSILSGFAELFIALSAVFPPVVAILLAGLILASVIVIIKDA